MLHIKYYTHIKYGDPAHKRRRQATSRTQEAFEKTYGRCALPRRVRNVM